MERVTLGFDTSCYTTSAAAVNDQGEVLCSARMLLPVAKGQRGLRQSEAVFAHVRQMPLVTDQLREMLSGKSHQIVAVCASSAPRDEADSYMPVFTVGYGHARTLANVLNVPLYTTSHQRGHIAAGQIGGTLIQKPFAALHLSGGTTELLYCDENELRIIGGSKDLHAGQLVDRVGVRLGLGFPAGPALERLALTCQEPSQALLSASMERGDLYCHFSGAETQVDRLLNVHSRERVALEIYDLLARVVSRLLVAGCQTANTDRALIVGGVASSALLRTLVARRLEKLRAPILTRFGEAAYSADNAAGVASIGMTRYLKETQDGREE